VTEAERQAAVAREGVTEMEGQLRDLLEQVQ
jgi:hypothetical protein